jgi:hypothetical protein
VAGFSTPLPVYGRPRHYGTIAAKGTGQAGALERAGATIVFAALLLATVALNAFKVGGVPIRGLFVLGALALSVLLYFDVAKRVLKDNLLLLGLAAGLAVLGIFVSLVNQASAAAVLWNVTEVHVQAAATIMVAAILARVAGPRASALAIVAVIAVSALVAAAQMMDMHAAWALRRALGPLTHEELQGLNLQERRPVGLAYSPIQFSTHLCLAFAAFVAVRDKLRWSASGADPLVVPALLALVAASIACATRSPILGGFVFIAAYALQRRTSWLPLFLIVAAVAVYFAWPMLMEVVGTNAPRVVRTDDNSAEARSTLVYYGLRLFADNPLGYGLTFAPMTLWQHYWPDLYMMQAPEGARENELHNYLVNMINTYGVGLLLFTPVVARLLMRSRASLIFFIPYIIHILFHNYGPFFNDNVIWFVIAAIAAANVEQDVRREAALRGIAAPALNSRPMSPALRRYTGRAG